MEQEDRLAAPSKVVSDVYENDMLRDGTVELERARGEFQLGHRDRARELLDSLALRLQPRVKESPEAATIYAASRVLDARIHESENETDKCREALRQAMEAYGHITDLENRAARALSDYGVALEMLGRHQAAARWLKRAKEKGLDTQSTFHYLGLAQKALGQLDAAAETLEEAEKRDAEDGVAIVALGEVLEARGDIGGAAEAYWRAAANAQLQEGYEESLLLIDKCIHLRRDDGPEKKAKDAGLRAAILGRLQRYPEALSEIERAIEIAPPKLIDRGTNLMAAAWRIKGRILLRMERWQEAADAFAEAISQDPENTVALVGRARTLMHLNHWAEALELVDRALKREPGNIDFLVDKAEVLRKLQKPEALETVQAALKLDPDSIYALEVCGGLLRQQKQFKEASSCFRRITELDSSKLDAWLDLADSLRQDGQAQEAIDTLDKAADRFGRLAPADAARLQTARGKALRDQGKRQEAAEAFSWSYRDSPSLQGFFDLLDALRQLQEYERALAAIDGYLAEHDPAPSEVLVHKAQLLSDLGEFAQAYEILRPIEKDDPAVFALRGWALEFQAFEPGARQFEFEKRALEEYRKAARLEPSLLNKLNVANSHRLLGQAGEARKIYEEVAGELARRSASLSPNELWTLGWCYLCLDNQAEAIRYLTAAVSAIKDGFPQFDLALAYLCDGRLGVAEREYREAIELVKQENPRQLRAVLLVAIEDLTVRSRLEPRISDETFQKILALLRGALDWVQQ
jgi:tetratricopeptide (TPR) repeat protein